MQLSNSRLAHVHRTPFTRRVVRVPGEQRLLKKQLQITSLSSPFQTSKGIYYLSLEDRKLEDGSQVITGGIVC